MEYYDANHGRAKIPALSELGPQRLEARKWYIPLSVDRLNIVLYSRRDCVWKLADFGLASEGTSGTLHFSADAKGTSGYRAPELIESQVYNNKVDIWSLGCILYELTVGQKAFKDDITTFEYKTSEQVLHIVLDGDIDDKYKERITRNILVMLKIDYSLRPSATDLLLEFSSNFQSLQAESTDPVQIHEIFSGMLS